MARKRLSKRPLLTKIGFLQIPQYRAPKNLYLPAPAVTDSALNGPAPKAAIDYKKLWQGLMKKERQKRYRGKKEQKKANANENQEAEKLMAMILESFLFLGTGGFCLLCLLYRLVLILEKNMFFVRCTWSVFYNCSIKRYALPYYNRLKETFAR